jgi:hypothetical protein
MYNQEHAVGFEKYPSASPALSVVRQRPSYPIRLPTHSMSKMATKRHDIAGRLIRNAICKNTSLGECIVSLDLGNKQRLDRCNLQAPDQAP